MFKNVQENHPANFPSFFGKKHKKRCPKLDPGDIHGSSSRLFQAMPVFADVLQAGHVKRGRELL